MKSLYLFVLSAVLLSAGCNSKTETAPAIDMQPATEASHSHASQGPHHGTLIELGNEQYHAELVHDDQVITIFLLDGSATKANPIASTDVAINLVHDGQPTQFKIPASPEENDPAGKSSRFTLQDPKLVEELEHDHAAAKLSVIIDGKAYRGEIYHDHNGHDHTN